MTPIETGGAGAVSQATPDSPLTNAPNGTKALATLQLALPGDLTPTAYLLPEGLTYDEWASAGTFLQAAVRGVQWWTGDWLGYGERAPWGAMYAQAIDETGSSYQALADAVWVAGKFEFSRRRENLSWSHHREVAALSEPEQEFLLDRAEEEGWTRETLRSAVRRTRQEQRIVEIGARERNMPGGPFQVVYADPPWRYEHNQADNRDIENQYPTMETEDIRALGETLPTTEDAILFMWATNPKLEEAVSVINAWGFTYRSNLVWVKDRIGMGYYARAQHELLLVAKKGEFPVPAEDDRPPSVIQAPRGEHSKKPDVVYDLIERMYPGVSRVELFARNTHDGWHSWGNQVG